MGADFEKDIEALGFQRRNYGRKLNRFADIVPPICRVELAPLDRRASNRRDEAQPAVSLRQPVELVQQLLADWVHVTAVERIIEVEVTKADAIGVDFSSERAFGCGVAGDRQRVC